MDIQITSRHEQASPSLRQTIIDEFGKLEKYSDRITSCHVIIDSQRGMELFEVVLNMAGHTINATSKAGNIRKAIDETLTKVQRQLSKINEKIKDHKNHGGPLEAR